MNMRWTHECNYLFIQGVNETFCRVQDSSKRQRKLNVTPPKCIKICPQDNTHCKMHLEAWFQGQLNISWKTNIKKGILLKVLKCSSVIQFSPHIQGIWLPIHQCKWIHLYETEVKIYEKKIKQLELKNITFKNISQKSASDDQKVKTKTKKALFFHNRNYHSIFIQNKILLKLKLVSIH